jgi:hypothetical protein
MTDGLGILDEQRQRRARSIPAPRNPPRSTPVGILELSPRSESEPVGSETAIPTAESEPKVGTAKPQRSAAAQEPTVKMSIYLEPSDDLYLEEIAHTGKTSRPRVAISRSAIVRLALEQLAKTMTTDEIVKELRTRGSQHQGRGRKRR